MYTIHLDDSFEKSQALNKKKDKALEERFLHLKSNKGFPVYNSHYKDLENYILTHVTKLNNNLRRDFTLNQSKSSCILDKEDPCMHYYLNKFPQKQYQIEAENLVLKPACCANAFKIWGTKGTFLKKKQIMHQLSDCYRVENLGTIRSFKRNCYFTMPDYHMITVKQDLFEDFKVIRSNLIQFFEQVHGPSWRQVFHQIIRVNCKDFQKYEPLIEHISDTSINKVFVQKMAYAEGSEPYFDLKYQLAYIGSSSLFTLGTIQIDYRYPKLFNLDTKMYGDRPALHFTPGGIQRIIEVLITENNLPYKGVKLFCKGVDHQSIINLLNLKCAYLIENKTIKEGLRSSQMEVLFYPILLIVGEKQLRDQTVSLANRATKQNSVCTLSQLRSTINNDSRYMDSKQIHYSSTFCK